MLRLGNYTIRLEKNTVNTANLSERFYDRCHLCKKITEELGIIELTNLPPQGADKVEFHICASCAYQIAQDIDDLFETQKPNDMGIIFGNYRPKRGKIET